MAAVMTPDGRVMNRMDSETKAVHVMLEAWGKWARHAEGNGWSPITILGRLIECGPQGSAQPGKPPISMPDDIARIDGAVAKLGDIDKRTIIAYYTRWEPIEVLARRLSMRERQMRSVLQRARWRLTAYLGL